jgi:hypothetical protein
MAVHDIDMNEIGAGGVDGFDFLTQPREIRGKNRGRDTDRAYHRENYEPDSGRGDKAKTPFSTGWYLLLVSSSKLALAALSAYVCRMTKLLEEAIQRVKALPEPDQDIAAEFLLGFADSEKKRYQLSNEQLREVELAKEQARKGEFATDGEMESLWVRSSH